MPRQSREVAGAGLLTRPSRSGSDSTTTIPGTAGLQPRFKRPSAEPRRIHAPDENTGRFGSGPRVKILQSSAEHVLQSDVPCLVANRVRVHLRGPTPGRIGAGIFRATSLQVPVSARGPPLCAAVPNGFRDPLGDQAESHFPGDGPNVPVPLELIPNQWPGEPRCPVQPGRVVGQGGTSRSFPRETGLRLVASTRRTAPPSSSFPSHTRRSSRGGTWSVPSGRLSGFTMWVAPGLTERLTSHGRRPGGGPGQSLRYPGRIK